MKTLIIFLKDVPKINNKIRNVVTYIIKNETEKYHYLDMHNHNIKKHQVSSFKL